MQRPSTQCDLATSTDCCFEELQFWGPIRIPKQGPNVPDRRSRQVQIHCGLGVVMFITQVPSAANRTLRHLARFSRLWVCLAGPTCRCCCVAGRVALNSVSQWVGACKGRAWGVGFWSCSYAFAFGASAGVRCYGRVGCSVPCTTCICKHSVSGSGVEKHGVGSVKVQRELCTQCHPPASSCGCSG